MKYGIEQFIKDYAVDHETFKSIPYFSDYLISSEGRVVSCRTRNIRFLKPYITRGLWTVHMYDRYGQGKTRYIYKLVLEAFVGTLPKDITWTFVTRDAKPNPIRAWDLFYLDESLKFIYVFNDETGEYELQTLNSEEL